MNHIISHAEQIRLWLNTVESSPKRHLQESTTLSEDKLLLETESHVNKVLIPALEAVFESYRQNVLEADAQGYTDEELLALAQKYPNVQDLIAAHKTLATGSSGGTPAQGKEEAVATLKKAAEAVMKKAESGDSNVKDPAAWIASKEDRLLQTLDKADTKGKYGKLRSTFQKLPKLAANHPRIANTLVGLSGVLIPILASGAWWAAPAAAILTKTVVDKLNGTSWKKAIAKNLGWSAIGMVLGAGASYAQNNIANSVDSWISGQREPIATGIPSGEAGDYASDKTQTGIPSGEAPKDFGGPAPRSEPESGEAPKDFGGPAAPYDTGEYNVAAGEEDKYIDSAPITVKPGDTLSKIAQQYGVSVKEIMAVNPDITNPDQIFAGEKLNIPTGSLSSTYQDNVGTAADTAQKLRTGEYTPRGRR